MGVATIKWLLVVFCFLGVDAQRDNFNCDCYRQTILHASGYFKRGRITSYWVCRYVYVIYVLVYLAVNSFDFLM